MIKLNKTVLGLAVALVVSPAWGHGSNIVWKTTDGSNLVTTDGECVRAVDFASLGRDSCHKPAMVEAAAEEVVAVEPVVEVTLKVVTHETIVNFATDSFELDMAAKLALYQLVELAREAEQLLAVQIVGHADTRGDADYNLALSQSRVEAVAGYLTSSGIKTSSSFAQGEVRPVMENGVENLAKSRRAEVLVKAQVKTMN